ncbi:F0F1 ATP synthase subunit B [bacterium]|nr:F0F1 ATP synthase subunit B [bacterium]
MLIDWFTVAAQVINFLILVWLLKRFLYKPILRAIDAREQRIETQLADADATKAEAQQERDEFLQKNKAFDQQRAARLSQATNEAQAERQRLLDKARQDSDALRAERQQALKREQQSLNAELSRRTREEVFAIARRALTDLAGASLEVRMSEVFARRLRALNDDVKEGLTAALETSSAPVLVRSTFELPFEQRAAIQSALNDTLSAEIQVRFETVPDGISGIELSMNGRKVAWSIADYLVSLEKSVGELLAEPFKPQAKPEAKPNSGTEPASSEEAE